MSKHFHLSPYTLAELKTLPSFIPIKNMHEPCKTFDLAPKRLIYREPESHVRPICPHHYVFVPMWTLSWFFFCPPSQRSCGRGILHCPSSVRPSVHQSIRPSVHPSVRPSDLNMQYLQEWNAPSPSINPYLLCSGNQRRGTLSLTRMQFFLFLFPSLFFFAY